MNRRKRPGAAHGLGDNPIIAAVQRSLRGRRPTVIILDGYERPRSGALRQHIAFLFSDEAIREIGILVIESLLTGDRRMVKIVKDAIKQADHIFNRDREPLLVKNALSYLLSLGRDLDGLDVVSLKKEIEKRFNNGKPLYQHQWTRLRKALRLPPLPTGNPRNSDTKRHQSVS